MIRLYRQTPEGIERTTQVDAAEQHLDSVFWIDLLTPEPAEIKFVERLCGLEMPTYDEMREIEATSRLYTEDGARFMTTTVLSRVDTESPSLSEITFVLMGAKSSPSAIRTPIPSAFFPTSSCARSRSAGTRFSPVFWKPLWTGRRTCWNVSARNWTAFPKTFSAGTNLRENPASVCPSPAPCA